MLIVNRRIERKRKRLSAEKRSGAATRCGARAPATKYRHHGGARIIKHSLKRKSFITSGNGSAASTAFNARHGTTAQQAARRRIFGGQASAHHCTGVAQRQAQQRSAYKTRGINGAANVTACLAAQRALHGAHNANMAAALCLFLFLFVTRNRQHFQRPSADYLIGDAAAIVSINSAA